ncbi:MAG: ATP-dependent DNA helicase [Metallosphaera sp.]
MELRNWQSTLKDKVAKALKQGILVALQSPTGSGKTLFSLVSALEVKPKVLFVVRTNNEFYPIYRDAKKLGKKFSFLMGKSKSCLYSDESAESEDIECSLCDSSSVTQVEMKDPPFSVMKGLKERGRIEKFCPYFSILSSISEADVVAVTYPYLFVPRTRESLDLDLDKTVIIVDEAHNLDNLNELDERRINEQTVNLALKEVKSEESIRILERLKAEIKRSVHPDERYIKVENYPKLDENELELLEDEYKDRREEMIRNKAIKRLHIGSVVKFYDSIKYYGPNDAQVFSMRGSLVLKPLLPTSYLSILNEEVPVLLMSGTMPPKDYLVNVFGIKRNILYVDVERELKEKVTGSFDCMLAVDVTSSFSSRGELMWRKYASYLLMIYYQARSNVLAIFPSYSIMDAVMSHVKVNKYVEGSRTNIEEILTESRSKKLIIAGVARGKLSEGVELTSEGISMISDVALCGIPYPPFDDYMKMRSEAIYRSTGQPIKEVLIEIPAVIAVKQAIGRAIRGKHDHATVWLLDKRFETAWWKAKINCFNPKKVKL